MFIFLRAAFLAGALLATGLAVNAEPIALPDALKKASESSPRISQAKAQAEAAEARARQAGVSPNPELGLEIEHFWPISGPLPIWRGMCALLMLNCAPPKIELYWLAMQPVAHRNWLELPEYW